MREATIVRKTNETDISVALQLDAGTQRDIHTGIGFFDHMLDLFGKHGFMDLSVRCEGDLNVDGHHTVEDVGIALGDAFLRALGDKKGIRRYGSVILPMDEALVRAAVDVSGRPFLVFDAQLPAALIGDFDAQLVQEFFRAFAFHAGIKLHIKVLSGVNLHHIVECMFKAVARALADAVTFDPRVNGVPSTKGVL